MVRLLFLILLDILQSRGLPSLYIKPLFQPPKRQQFSFFIDASLLNSHMVEIFSPQRLTLLMLLCKSDLVCENLVTCTLTVFVTNKFHFHNSKWSVVSIAKWDYGIRWTKRGKQIPIAPLCFRRCSTAIVSAAAAAAYGFQGGKQILIDHKSGPTIRFWRGCKKAFRSSALLFVWKQSFLHMSSQTKGRQRCKKALFHRAWDLVVEGGPFFCLFLIKLVLKLWFILGISQ